MNAEGDGNMGSLAKGCMLRRIMSLTKVVNTVTEKNSDQYRKGGNEVLQIANDDVHGRGRIIRSDCDMPTGFITCLRKFTHD